MVGVKKNARSSAAVVAQREAVVVEILKGKNPGLRFADILRSTGYDEHQTKHVLVSLRGKGIVAANRAGPAARWALTPDAEVRLYQQQTQAELKAQRQLRLERGELDVFDYDNAVDNEGEGRWQKGFTHLIRWAADPASASAPPVETRAPASVFHYAQTFL